MEWGNIFTDRLPKFFDTDLIVIVNKYMPRAGNVFPWCCWMSIAVSRRQFIGSFTYNLHILYYSIEKYLINFNVFQSLTTGKFSDIADGL